MAAGLVSCHDEVGCGGGDGRASGSRDRCSAVGFHHWKEEVLKAVVVVRVEVRRSSRVIEGGELGIVPCGSRVLLFLGGLGDAAFRSEGIHSKVEWGVV